MGMRVVEMIEQNEELRAEIKTMADAKRYASLLKKDGLETRIEMYGDRVYIVIKKPKRTNVIVGGGLND